MGTKQYTKKEAKAYVAYLTKCIDTLVEAARFVERTTQEHQQLAAWRTHRAYLRQAYGVK